MNEMNHSSTCERASDLVAFLYNETNESETRDFELHLKECRNCREEVASFGVVRQSIAAWRDEALSGFVSTPVTTAPARKSALAALRQFFDLSPLWLRGASAFAVVAFCVLVGLVVFRVPQKEIVSSKSADPNLIYTKQDVDRMLKEALAKQETAQPQERVVVVQSLKPKRTPSTSRLAKSRRPLTRAEREQLAADLRLLSPHDDVDLNLLGDRINQ